MNNDLIEIIDVGLGNVASIHNMLNFLGYNSVKVTKPEHSNNPRVLILPGVGSWDYAIEKLLLSGWFDFIKKYSENKNNLIIGICLGMQILCEKSEEGKLKGLSLISGEFKKFVSNKKLKVPHMGWNEVHFNNKFKFKMDSPKFYHVHSYYYFHSNKSSVIAHTKYGENFPSAIMKNNVLGFQFHPEKSHIFGKELFKYILKNYAKL